MTDLPDLPLLLRLLSVDSPAGDEAAMADFLSAYLSARATDYGGLDLIRRRDNLIVVRGAMPQTAVFAHIDTTGFTAGYGESLIPIGCPDPRAGDRVRGIGDDPVLGEVRVSEDGDMALDGATAMPGSRLVYAAQPEVGPETVVSAYLDNRAGIWAALQVLNACERVAVCFTCGEEIAGSGASVCAELVYRQFGIEQALVCDATWDTEWVKCGGGPAISRRDAYVPRQSYVERLLGLAHMSGEAYQIEVESSGGSDGAGIERSGFPIDWAFVGAPQKRPHSSAEEVCLADLDAMARLIAALVRGLTRDADMRQPSERSRRGPS